MIIIVDDEDRENEGDLFVAAARATPEAINFMATHGRGLISLALTEERMRSLGLSLITGDTGNQTRFGTAFATPIDAREGVGSGMSAHDRARTVAVVLAFPSLFFNVPFGTALGIYTLWVLLPAESDVEYEKEVRSASAT